MAALSPSRPEPGVTRIPGIGAYAISRQCSLASIPALARENPRLHVSAVEPDINPAAGHFLTTVLTDRSGKTGIDYHKKGEPMIGSILAHDPPFEDRVVAEIRSFPAKTSAVQTGLHNRRQS